MKIIVLYFGKIAEICGKASEEFEGTNDMNSLISFLHTKYNSLQFHKYMISVNKKIFTQNVAFNDGDEIALLPPFSGG